LNTDFFLKFTKISISTIRFPLACHSIAVAKKYSRNRFRLHDADGNGNLTSTDRKRPAKSYLRTDVGLMVSATTIFSLDNATPSLLFLNALLC